MLEAVAMLSLGASVLLYLELQSKKEEIDRLCYKIRHLTGELNKEDKEEDKNLWDRFNFKTIVYAIIEEDELDGFLDREEIIDEAKRRFKQKYGYEFKEPFHYY